MGQYSRSLLGILFLYGAFYGEINAQTSVGRIHTDTIYSYQYKLDSLALLTSIEFLSKVNFQIKNEFPVIIEIDSVHSLPVIIRYQVAARQFFDVEGVRDRRLYEPRIIDEEKIRERLSKSNSSSSLLSSYPSLYKAGSISRGVTVGNQQNLFVNSSLNLQLQGEIGDDLSVTAVITDQNIPFQPEGNTQQLRDFDNVYLSLASKKSRITAGDIVVDNSDKSYFLKYYKNQQGFKLEDVRTFKNDWKSTSNVSVGIAKGRFASIRLDPQEGVNGPYRLRGANNERFIIVIANSEQIFLDGAKLKRGFNEDYIIDYNLGEITFTSRVLITRFSRLRVDFEYTNQSYLRSNTQFYQSVSNDKNQFFIEYFQSSDNPNRSLQLQFNDSTRALLSDVTQTTESQFLVNQISQAPSAEPGNYYIEKDTIIAGKLYTIFEYQRKGNDLLNVTFTETAQGDYVVAGQNAFGRIFQFIPPQNGVSQGDYQAGVILSLPQRQSMVTLGHSTEIRKGIKFSHQVALNHHDENLFNSNDKKNGLAWVGEFSYEKDFNTKTVLNMSMKGEYNSTDFSPVDRFRTVEFDRDWNYPFPGDSVGNRELLLYSDISLTSVNHNLSYRNVIRDRYATLSGMQQWLSNKHRFGVLHYSGSHFLMQNKQQLIDSEWLRSFNEVYVESPFGELGFFRNLDQNLLFSADSVMFVRGSAMYYTETGFFFRKNGGKQLITEIKLLDREDERPVNGERIPYTSVKQADLKLDWISKSKSHKVMLTSIFRNTNRTDSVSLPNDEVAQGGLQVINKLLSGAITSKLNYMSQNSMELRRDFIYTQVGAGQGTHTWRDENDNGIPELNEFYEAINQDEKNYIRLFVPTDDYQQAYSVNYQHTINWKVPSNLELPFILKSLDKLSGLFSWNINSKSSNATIEYRLNPFIDPTMQSLIMKRDYRSHAVFYNRNKPGLGLSLNKTSSARKQLNVNGFELDDKKTFSYAVRYLFARKIQFELRYSDGQHEHDADFLKGRQFLLNQRDFSIENSWLPTAKTRISIGYHFKKNENILQEFSTEFIKSREFTTNFSFIVSGKRNFNSLFSYIDNQFEGTVNSFLGYTLLNGLQPGRNFKIQVNVNQKLNNGLQLSLNYFGRKSESQRIINSGSLNVTAFF